MAQSQILQNTKVDLLSSRSPNLGGRIFSNSGNAVNPQDLVPLSQVQSLINSAVVTGKPSKNVIDIGNTVINGSGANAILTATGGVVLADSSLTYSNGLLTVADINLTSLTVSEPVKTDGSKNLVSGLIILTSDVSGILPIANGGTNSNTAANARIALNAAVAGQTVTIVLSAGGAACGGSQGVTVPGASFTAPAGGGACTGSFSFTINGSNFSYLNQGTSGGLTT